MPEDQNAGEGVRQKIRIGMNRKAPGMDNGSAFRDMHCTPLNRYPRKRKVNRRRHINTCQERPMASLRTAAYP